MAFSAKRRKNASFPQNNRAGVVPTIENFVLERAHFHPSSVERALEHLKEPSSPVLLDDLLPRVAHLMPRDVKPLFNGHLLDHWLEGMTHPIEPAHLAPEELEGLKTGEAPLLLEVMTAEDALLYEAAVRMGAAGITPVRRLRIGRALSLSIVRGLAPSEETHPHPYFQYLTHLVASTGCPEALLKHLLREERLRPKGEDAVPDERVSDLLVVRVDARPTRKRVNQFPIRVVRHHFNDLSRRHVEASLWVGRERAAPHHPQEFLTYTTRVAELNLPKHVHRPQPYGRR